MPMRLRLPYRFETERLVLRCYEPDDAPALFECVQAHRAYLAEWLPWAETAHMTLGDSEASVRRNRGRYDLMEDFTLGIFDRSGRLLGGTGLHAPDAEAASLKIGYWLRPDATGRGYASEAAWRLTRVAFEVAGVERLEIRAVTENMASRRVPERLGFHLEGILRAAASLRGERRDLALYALVRSEYASR